MWQRYPDFVQLFLTFCATDMEKMQYFKVESLFEKKSFLILILSKHYEY